MKAVSLAAFVLLLSASAINAQAQPSDGFASEASRVVATYQPKSREHTPEAMAVAAQAFLKSLDEEQRQRATYALDHQERREWTNLPARPNAGGIRFGDLNADQVKACCDMMGTLFSEQGYAKMVNIMLADDQLLRGARRRSGFGTENFSVVLFGKPSLDQPWAFQLDGHHVGVNVAVNGEQLSMSPSFIGTQPEAYHLADKQIRPLSGEIDGAYELVNRLSDAQRQQAIVSQRRGRIKTGPGNDGKIPSAAGVACGEFTAPQRELLMALIAEWVNNLPAKQAKQRLEQIDREVDQMVFAWHGPTKSMSDISYTIQSPSLIIEYACQDLGGKPTDHLHTMYRDPTNEYGGQLGK